MSALAVLVSMAAAAAPRPLARGGVGSEGFVLEQSTSHSFRSMVGMVKQEDELRVHLSPAGVRVQTVTPGPRGGEPVPSKFYTIFRVERARPAAARRPTGGGAGRGAGASDRIVRIEVNGFKRTYREESLAERAAANEAARKALEKRMTKLAREGRGGAGGPLGGLAALMGGGAPPGASRGSSPASGAPVVAKRTADTKSIAGMRCRRYEFHQGGNKAFEAWYTEKPAPKWVRRFDIEESPGSANEPLMKARRSTPGIELESTLYLPAGGRREVRTKRITRKAVPESLLRPPKGYRKVEPPRRPEPPKPPGRAR